ncbi:uncharacterized protein LAJ45_08431 [Morchella importuna]|uniref:uncharacterized protein n=1 Tax=Morchella importuna TaxID=1174673 RepID=UPI001E8D67A2|nr:uncharacterized protein LAJ45_08431 [Morchella importuna]KAH8147603.1 hypothetical protein LAJ45_08431 [Morchella importuna]
MFAIPLLGLKIFSLLEKTKSSYGLARSIHYFGNIAYEQDITIEFYCVPVSQENTAPEYRQLTSIHSSALHYPS